MARLNEPPQPSLESIDALKRRFVRQNREIARANSTQSLRIRTLESEVSRLLSENVSLREQIIKLHYEVEKSTSRAVSEGVVTVKGKLEAKLAELGGLVKELGNVQKTADDQRAQKRKSLNRSSPKRSPDQRNWKNALTLSEVTGGADGRLPPILEDKYYPRRTMDAEELLGILADPNNVTDSPDLGPPPVAHFDEGDPIKFDPSQEQAFYQAPAESNEHAQPKLSANLETRKRRRESSHQKDVEIKRASTDPVKVTSSKDASITMTQTLKSGAKRKLNVRDDDDEPRGVDRPEKDEFQFSRNITESKKNENTISKSIATSSGKPANDKSSQVLCPGAEVSKEKAAEGPVKITSTSRKALGTKSVNTDPMHSPVKLSRFVKDKSVETKDDLAKIVRERNTQKDRPLAKDPDPTADKKASVKRVEPPPETPAPPPNDLLSPTASEPSAARPESRDTPPPPDLGPDTGTGSFGRSSRRHRGSVNYAQPNLRVKMRRPTKDLVDAVAAEERERIAKAKDDASRPVRIKREEAPDALPVWKTNVPKESQSIRAEPTSPLENKIRTSESELPDSVITDRRRRTTVPSRIGDENDPSRPTSGASSAIAALTAGTQRPKRHEADKPTSEAEEVGENVQGRAEKPSIFDITGSSPMDSGDNETTEANVEDTANAATRSSRRHSGLPASSEPWKGSFTISRRGERRRETLSSREGEDHTEKRDRLSTRKSVLDMGSAGDEAIMGRGERAASRRRSMMM